VPRIWGFPLTSIVALTTVLRTTVLHREKLLVLYVPNTNDDLDADDADKRTDGVSECVLF